MVQSTPDSALELLLAIRLYQVIGPTAVLLPETVVQGVQESVLTELCWS